MSNALKNVVESGRSVVESGTSTLSDLVDEARSMIDDLPPRANARRKQTRKNWSSLFVIVLVAFVAMVVAKQVRHHPAESAPERNGL